MQNAMCSSRSTPRSRAPFTMSSRLTVRAKALSFIFLRTDFASTSANDFPGLTSAQAVMNPARTLAGDAGIFRVRHNRAANLVGIFALFQNFVAIVRMLLRAGILFVIEIVDQSDHAPQVFVCGKLSRIGARMQASTAKACLRRLSDWVNSVSRFQAAERSGMIVEISDSIVSEIAEIG